MEYPADLKASYLEELALYDQVLHVTGLLSLNQHDIKTDGRGVRAVKIFTRQTLTGLSLQRILPRPTVSGPVDEALWDLCSVASLARNILEGYLGLHYFGLEKITGSEAELRFFILQLHRNIEWYNIKKLTDPQDPELKQFEEGIPEQKLRIREHRFLPNLLPHQRKLALETKEMYKTKGDFEKELPVCSDLKRNYRQLSNLVHPVPMSVERTDNLNGRGLGSDADMTYSLLCVMIARRYLAASTVGIADHFPKKLAKRFSGELAPIRPLVKAGFK